MIHILGLCSACFEWSQLMLPSTPDYDAKVAGIWKQTKQRNKKKWSDNFMHLEGK